jgi:hypothetical protein
VRLLLPAVLILSLFSEAPSLLAEHVSIWGGGGLGSFLAGASSDVEGHKFGALSISFDRDRFHLRYLRGSFEREKGVAPGVGDADVDYSGVDLVFTRKMTRLPVDVSVGADLFKEARLAPAGETGGRVFDRRWGPHFSVARTFPIWKRIVAWTELDVNSVRFRARQVLMLFDTGIGLHF